MKILIADDELNNRLLLKKILSPYGQCDMVANGSDALTVFEHALGDNTPYNLICLDIMMPMLDGQETLRRIRELEKQMDIPAHAEATIFMISALDSPQVVMESFHKGGCTDYLTKPVLREKVLEKLREYGLIES
ncbi:MAG: response regulator [Magnetococcus sp. DMHC-1]|nr:response regulator [Magnetococcales bacterium]